MNLYIKKWKQTHKKKKGKKKLWLTKGKGERDKLGVWD